VAFCCRILPSFTHIREEKWYEKIQLSFVPDRNPLVLWLYLLYNEGKELNNDNNLAFSNHDLKAGPWNAFPHGE
jgi:hypothetical protein